MRMKPIYVLSLVVLLLSCGPKEIPYFVGESAFRYLEAQTAFGPRNPGSEGAAQCKDYLVAELQKSADRIAVQPFAFTDTLLGETYELNNIIASFNLDPPGGRRILLAAHWDTRPRADKDPDPEKRHEPILGANDGASGVAVLLEAARIFKQNPPDMGVDIILFDGEDYGEEGNLDWYCLGSKYFTQTMGDYRPHFGILLDLVGERDVRFPMEGYSIQYAQDLTLELWEKAEERGLTAFVKEYSGPIYDDHLILNQAGIPTVDIIDIDYDYWHTTGDTPDKCSAESLAQVGTLVMAVIYE